MPRAFNFLVLAAPLLAAACFPANEQARTAIVPRGPRPLVLVTLDTTRPDHLQPYGAEHVATPTLLSLARQGIVFEQAMAVAPITLVAHTSLLTGLYPPHHGVRNNGIHHATDELDTLAEILGAEGYRTAAFVSASVLERRYGLDQGFEVYDDDLSTGKGRHPRVVPDRPATATVDAARRWLDSLEGGELFFLWVHFYDPHAVYSPPPPYRDRYRDDLYAGEIAYVDAELGRLLDHPALARAAVTVIGDHGESLGEHGEQTHAILAYQSTLHIPWLLSVPGGPAGHRVPRPVSQVDVLPSLLELLAVAAPASLDGRSVLPSLEGRPAAAPDPVHYAETYLPYYTYGWARLRVARRDGWKLIDGPRPELYDLDHDPGETSDHHQTQSRQAESLNRALAELIDGEEDHEKSLQLDSEAAARLRSLGYLSTGAAPHQGPRKNPKEVIDLHVGLERARGLVRERREPEAERELRRVLDRDPDNLAALVDLASARELQGDLDGATAALERAMVLDPDYANLHVLMARLESRRDRPQAALGLLDAALELEPRNLEARVQKATVLARLGRRREVRRVLDDALQDEGEHPRLLTAVAQLLDRDPAVAGARLRRALERDPHLLLAWRLLGRNLESEGRWQEAADAYRQGLSRFPDDTELHAELGGLLARTGGDAEIHLREALRLTREERPEVRVALGAHLAERGQITQALELYDQVLAADPEHLGARNNRAVALYRSGQVAEARRMLDELVKRHPEHADSHNNLAALAVDGGRWAEAEGHARRALEADPSLANAWLNLGLAHAGQRRVHDAERAYRRAAELAPHLWTARFHLGTLLIAGDHLEVGLELLRAIATEVPSFPEVHLVLGEFYAARTDDARRARAHLNAFLRLAPKDPRSSRVQRQLTALSLGANP